MPKASSLWVLLALTAASIEPILVKLGYRQGVSPLQLLVMRNAFAALALLLITRRWHWLGLQGVLKVGSVAVLLLATNGLMMVALQHMSAVTVITGVTITPAFVAIVNQIRGRDVLTARFWLGFAACFFGVLFTVDAFEAATTSVHPHGMIALALAVATSTTYRTRLETITQTYKPQHVSTYIFLINAMLGLLFIAPFIDMVPLRIVPLTAWMGLAAAFANFAFLSAIRLFGSTRMSIFDMLQRPIVIVAAALILSEPLRPIQGVGIVLVLVGVQMAKVKKKVESKPVDSFGNTATPSPSVSG